jgi:hypothetical protein
MEAKTMLDQLAEGIERVLKSQGATGAPKTRKMTPDALMAHAVAEIQKAAGEPAERAKRRLAALSRAVDTAKQAYVDTASEDIEVVLFEEDTTARADESEKETSPVALEAALGNAAFASNPEDLHKALGRLAKDLAGLRGEAPADKPKAEGEKVAKEHHAEWPFDMNTKAFREGVQKAEDGPAWGYDPGRADATAKP